MSSSVSPHDPGNRRGLRRRCFATRWAISLRLAGPWRDGSTLRCGTDRPGYARSLRVPQIAGTVLTPSTGLPAEVRIGTAPHRYAGPVQRRGSDGSAKTPYLTVYDYGQGGIWRVILARSADQIAARYPELKILSAPPDWMSDEQLREIEQHSTVDIDDHGEPFLAALRTQRGEADG